MRGATASELFTEAERHGKDWDYVQWADALRGRPVLLVAADDQNHTDMDALGWPAAFATPAAATP